MTMQERTTADAVVAAYRALLDQGTVPSVRAVLAAMRERENRGASMRDVVPLVANLRKRSLADPAIERVVRMYLSLDAVARVEVRRRIDDLEGRT